MILKIKPKWLRVYFKKTEKYKFTETMNSLYKLNTVCFSASCPNLVHCWKKKISTYLIMGNRCTRSCLFCGVNSTKIPTLISKFEASSLKKAVKYMDLQHIVITSVARDDMIDGGAYHYVKCIKVIRIKKKKLSSEILLSEMQGSITAIKSVMAIQPSIFNHNLETVERLTNKIRSIGTYKRSLQLLLYIKQKYNIKTKSALILGLGEKNGEIIKTIYLMRNSKVHKIAIGQYLKPTISHLNVIKYVKPQEFLYYYCFSINIGFEYIESSPLVRASFQAKL